MRINSSLTLSFSEKHLGLVTYIEILKSFNGGLLNFFVCFLFFCFFGFFCFFFVFVCFLPSC